jgi:hypothetical protein
MKNIELQLKFTVHVSGLIGANSGTISILESVSTCIRLGKSTDELVLLESPAEPLLSHS